jgi:hypothetical protein
MGVVVSPVLGGDGGGWGGRGKMEMEGGIFG